MFYTENCVIAYEDTDSARRWWIAAFNCKETTLPEMWDDPVPGDIALKLPGQDSPTILLCKKPAEGRVESSPILFTSNLERAHKHLVARGINAGPIDVSGGLPHFDVQDLEGNSIEICLGD